FLPQFLQTPSSAGYGFGLSVTQSGLVLLPQSATLFVAGILSGRLAARHGSKRVLVAGTGLTAVALLGLTLAHDQLWQVLASVVLMGFAIGLAFAAMSNLVVESVPAAQTGVASGMNANIRTVGGSIGAAVMATIVTASVFPNGLPRESGYTHGFIALMVVMLGAAAVALLIPRVDRPTIEEHLVGEPEHAELGILAGGTLVGDKSE
ncbi:MAG: transporter, partial [Marmoricola sp.]|nr:transporter [Marmoricola sp.]